MTNSPTVSNSESSTNANNPYLRHLQRSTIKIILIQLKERVCGIRVYNEAEYDELTKFLVKCLEQERGKEPDDGIELPFQSDQNGEPFRRLTNQLNGLIHDIADRFKCEKV